MYNSALLFLIFNCFNMLYTISIIVEYIRASIILKMNKFAPNILNAISPIMKNIGVIITFASLYIW